MAQEALIKELLTQNIELRKLQPVKNEEEYASKFMLLSTSPTLKISGILISEGVWKGVRYSYDEMKKSLSKFSNLKGLVLHGRTSEFLTKQVGRITKVLANDSLKALVFEAEVDDEKAIERIKDGTYDAVSISGGFNNLDKNSTPMIGYDYEPIEWSLTGSPACDRCMIFSYEELSKAFKDVSCKDITSTYVAKEEISMSKEQVKEQPKIPETQPIPKVETAPTTVSVGDSTSPQPPKKEEVKEIPKEVPKEIPKAEIKQEPQRVEVVVRVEQQKIEEKPKETVKDVQPPSQPIPQPSQSTGTDQKKETTTHSETVSTETPPNTQIPKPPLSEQEKPMTPDEMFAQAKKEGKLMDFAVALMERDSKKRHQG